MKKNINQIFGKDAHIKIYFLPWLIALSFILRLVTVYFFRDVQIDNEWNILLENLVKDGSYSFYTFEGISIPSVLLPPLYPFFLYFYSMAVCSLAYFSIICNISFTPCS